MGAHVNSAHSIPGGVYIFSYVSGVLGLCWLSGVLGWPAENPKLAALLDSNREDSVSLLES